MVAVVCVVMLSPEVLILFVVTQLNVEAMLPVNERFIAVPEQIVLLLALVTEGSGLTVTVEVVEDTHPCGDVPVTVYTVVVVGLALTLTPLVELSPVAGLQL